MHLESPKTTIEKSQESLFRFLTKVENYEQLMPENKERFEVLNSKSFLFQLKGMPEIELEVKETQPASQVVLGARNDKMPFTLTAHIEPVSATESTVVLDFEGKFNAMMAMMVKGPIQKFINTLAENLRSI